MAALPPSPGVTVHHLDEDEQRAFLHEVIGRSGGAPPDRLLELMLPSGVSYGACTNRAFLIAQALGCTSVHRRDSDSRYQHLDGEPVFPSTRSSPTSADAPMPYASRRPGASCRRGPGNVG